MPRKCSVYGCKTNYATGRRGKVFSFPKNPEERARWIQILPNTDFKWTKQKGVCAAHWPTGYPTWKARSGKLIPAVPPSIFSVTTPPPMLREMNTLTIRNTQLEEVPMPTLVEVESTDAVDRSAKKVVCSAPIQSPAENPARRAASGASVSVILPLVSPRVRSPCVPSHPPKLRKIDSLIIRNAEPCKLPTCVSVGSLAATDNAVKVVCAAQWHGSRCGESSLAVSPSTSSSGPRLSMPTPPPPMLQVLTVRNAQPFRLPLEVDNFDATNYAKKLANVAKDVRVFSTDSEIRILADDRSGCIPNFSIFISKETQLAECYSKFVKVAVPFMSEVRVSKVSQVRAIIDYLRFYEHDDGRISFIERQIDLISGNRRFNSYDLANAFALSSKGAACYDAFCELLVLPSQRLLVQLSKCGNVESINYAKKLLGGQEAQQRHCVLLCEEVHVHCDLQATNESKNALWNSASTVLAVMCVCLFGGAKFCVRLLPVMNMSGAFLSEVIRWCCVVIRDGGGRVVAIVADNFRVNAAFSSLVTDAKFPWRVLSPEGQPVFLLYDPKHLLKNLRNCWISSGNKELQFRSFQSKVVKVAKWKCVESLLVDRNQKTATSRLTARAVRLNPIERHSVSLVQQVFSDNTVALLRVNGASDTADFVQLFVQFWKVCTVDALHQHIRLNDAFRQAVIGDDAWQFKFLSSMASLAQYMCPTSRDRLHSLTRDTANALYSTCHGLTELCKHLFSCNVRFVLLGQFNTERLERHFGKLRQVNGGTKLTNIRLLVQKRRLDKASMLLDWNADNAVESSVDANTHSCKWCMKKSSVHLDMLPLLVRDVPDDVKAVLVYVAGYLTSKYCSCEDCADSCFEYDLHGRFLNSTTCARRTVPRDRTVNFVYFAYVSFLCLQSDSMPPCFFALLRSLSRIQVLYDLLHSDSEAKSVCLALCNILLNSCAKR